MKLIRTSSGLKAIGIPEGRFVYITQGEVNESTAEVRHRDDDTPQVRSYQVFFVREIFEKPEWGSGCYKVRADGSLQYLEDNYDCSD